MEDRVPFLTTARRFIPWLLVWVLIPLTTAVIYIGWGRKVAKEYWDLVGP